MITTTLDNLPAKIRENRMRNLAINIVKYQDFKTSAIIPKIDNCGYAQGALSSYIGFGICYIKKGTKNKKAGNIYNYIDEALKNHVQPLVPSESERRRVAGVQTSRKVKDVSQVQKVLDGLYTKASKTQTHIAVQISDYLSIVDNQEEANGFNKCLEFLGKQAGKVVKITIEEV